MAAPHVAGILLSTDQPPIQDGNVSNDPSESASWADPIASVNTIVNAIINGPYQIEVNEPVQFTANVSGGIPPYSYSWEIDYNMGSGPWQSVGGNAQYYGHTSYNDNDFALRVHVTDSNNTTNTSVQHHVMVNW